MPQLSFGEYRLLGDNIIEFLPNAGVEVDAAEALECRQVYEEIGPEVLILVNRSQPYSSTFEFIMSIMDSPELKAIAIYAPNNISAIVADTQKPLSKVPFERFHLRDEAINWLKRHNT